MIQMYLERNFQDRKGCRNAPRLFFNMKKINKQSEIALKTFKKERRDEEIKLHGKQISGRTKIQKSKKLYKRSNEWMKQEQKD